MSLAALDRVAKRYGEVVAVTGVTLDLRPSETMVLVGHNGAGKTTLMKLMLGLIRPTAGTVRVRGLDPAGGQGAEARRSIGFLPESVVFEGGLTGAEALAFYARLKGADRKQCAPLLERVGLAFAAHRRLSGYSKGMRQRLGLAQALLGSPPILLLDEPTTGLDPDSRTNLYGLVDEARARGTAVVLSSHALAEVEQRADRIALMDRGRLVACDTLEALRRASGLPVAIRLTMPHDRIGALPPGLSPTPTAAHRVELQVANDDKVTALRRIAGVDAGIEDIEVVPPSLEQIYGHLRRREAAE